QRSPTGPAVARQAGPMPGPEVVRDEHLDRLPDRFGLGIAEDRLGGWIPEHDPAALHVAHDDRFADRPEEPTDAEVARLQACHGSPRGKPSARRYPVARGLS